MKRLTLRSILMIMIIGGISCSTSSADTKMDNPYKSLELNDSSKALAEKGNDFAFRFLDRVSDATRDDYLISPLSMQFLLGMVLDGAQGRTADEICKVLGYGAGETQAVNEYCLTLLRQLPELDKKTTLNIANAIVVNHLYPLHEAYKDTVGKYFEAAVANTDFSDVNPTTNSINDWCSDHTEGMIPKIIDEVDPNMLAYLMNAMYFKSSWREPFPVENTADETFTSEDGKKATVPMMKNRGEFRYHENGVFRAVHLMYGNSAYSMTVILPEEGKTLSEVTDYLDAEKWDECLSWTERLEMSLWLPKFETKVHIKLNDILSDMGMPLSFDPAADFKAMSNYALCLSVVQQDAAIKVDEEGAEAAVVSSAEMRLTSAVVKPRFVIFHADRPFIYIISESSTGAVLFAGRYSAGL